MVKVGWRWGRALAGGQEAIKHKSCEGGWSGDGNEGSGQQVVGRGRGGTGRAKGLSEDKAISQGQLTEAWVSQGQWCGSKVW